MSEQHPVGAGFSPRPDAAATLEAIPPGARHDAPPAQPVDAHTESRLEALRQVVAASNITRIAKQIGVSRPALSLVLAGRYHADPDRVLAKFWRWHTGVDCPHLGQRLTDDQCRDYAHAKRPGNPLGLAHYRACRQCPHRGGR